MLEKQVFSFMELVTFRKLPKIPFSLCKNTNQTQII